MGGNTHPFSHGGYSCRTGIALDRLESTSEKSVVDIEEFEEAFGRLGSERFTSVSYIDSAAKLKAIEALYGLLPKYHELDEEVVEKLEFDADTGDPKEHAWIRWVREPQEKPEK